MSAVERSVKRAIAKGGYTAKLGKDAGLAVGKMVKNGALVVVGEGNANVTLDSLLQTVTVFLKLKYNPLKIDDVAEGVLWLRVWGLPTVHRVGPATMTQHKLYETFLHANIALNDLMALTSINMQICWFIWFKGIIRADISRLLLATKLRISLSEKMKPKLVKLDVKDWGVVKTNITEGNWLGTVISWFPFITTSILKIILPDKLYSAVEDILESIDFKFPH